MVDLTTRTIKRIFERQVKELTYQSLANKEDSFDFQFSGGWL